MKTAIIGGGASGMTSAIFAARNKNSVTVFERSDRTMKKLLATGNGRCNLSNKDLSAAHFHSSDRKALEKLLSGFTKDMEEAFFESIGIMLVDENGRLYPRSRRASSVVDALRFEADSLNVKIIYNTAVKEI